MSAKQHLYFIQQKPYVIDPGYCLSSYDYETSLKLQSKNLLINYISDSSHVSTSDFNMMVLLEDYLINEDVYFQKNIVFYI